MEWCGRMFRLSDFTHSQAVRTKLECFEFVQTNLRVSSDVDIRFQKKLEEAGLKTAP
jgi:hypothetical protein